MSFYEKGRDLRCGHRDTERRRPGEDRQRLEWDIASQVTAQVGERSQHIQGTDRGPEWMECRVEGMTNSGWSWRNKWGQTACLGLMTHAWGSWVKHCQQCVFSGTGTCPEIIPRLWLSSWREVTRRGQGVAMPMERRDWIGNVATKR